MRAGVYQVYWAAEGGEIEGVGKKRRRNGKGGNELGLWGCNKRPVNRICILGSHKMKGILRVTLLEEPNLEENTSQLGGKYHDMHIPHNKNKWYIH